MQEPFESWLGECFVTFDGRVLESFSTRPQQAGRLHVAMIERMAIDEHRGRHYLHPQLRPRGTGFMIYFAAEQLETARWLAQAIESAGARYR